MLLTALHVSIATNTTQMKRPELDDMVLRSAVKNNYCIPLQLLNTEPIFTQGFRILGPKIKRSLTSYKLS